jgi:hypothetical protein
MKSQSLIAIGLILSLCTEAGASKPAKTAAKTTKTGKVGKDAGKAGVKRTLQILLL